MLLLRTSLHKILNHPPVHFSTCQVDTRQKQEEAAHHCKMEQEHKCSLRRRSRRPKCVHRRQTPMCLNRCGAPEDNVASDRNKVSCRDGHHTSLTSSHFFDLSPTADRHMNQDAGTSRAVSAMLLACGTVRLVPLTTTEFRQLAHLKEFVVA